LQDVFQLGGIDVITDERRIGVDVFRRGQPDHFERVWVAAVNEDEFGFGVAGVAKNIFEVERVAIAQAEIIADADGAMEMDRQIEFAGLVDQYAKDIILKDAVVVVGGNAAGVVLAVNGFGLFARGIAEIEAAEVGGLKLHGHAAFFLIVGQGLGNAGLIAGKIDGQAADIFLLHVAMQNLFLQRDVHAHVRVLSGL